MSNLQPQYKTSPTGTATFHRDQPDESGRDERVAIPLDPETALRGLLKVDPKSEPER
jgi:hypothetical protein